MFISCVKSSGNDINIEPEDLTKLAIVIKEAVKSIKVRSFVLIDPITAFTVYHDQDKISKFVSAMNNSLMRQNCAVLWISIPSESDKSFISKISSLCDKTIDVK